MATLLTVLQPPGVGAPCNGCGFCCREEVCGLGLEVLGAGAQAPCLFLRERDGRTFCGVVEEAAKKDIAFGGWLAWRLGIGQGCIVQPVDQVAAERQQTERS